MQSTVAGCRVVDALGDFVLALSGMLNDTIAHEVRVEAGAGQRAAVTLFGHAALPCWCCFGSGGSADLLDLR